MYFYPHSRIFYRSTFKLQIMDKIFKLALLKSSKSNILYPFQQPDHKPTQLYNKTILLVNHEPCPKPLKSLINSIYSLKTP